jgi:hypothetical protein
MKLISVPEVVAAAERLLHAGKLAAGVKAEG